MEERMQHRDLVVGRTSGSIIALRAEATCTITGSRLTAWNLLSAMSQNRLETDADDRYQEIFRGRTLQAGGLG